MVSLEFFFDIILHGVDLASNKNDYQEILLGKSVCTPTGFLPESDPAPVVEFFTHTGISAAGGQFDFERCTRKMFVHRNRKRNLLVLLYLRRKYKKTRKTVLGTSSFNCRYLEGSFYTLFEKLKSHDSKFFSYFRMSVSTFEFLVMRLSDRIKGQDTPMRACVPPKEMLAVTIR